jgi:hypothetical protein
MKKEKNCEWPEHVTEMRKECLYCKKRVIVTCGTPVIQIGGCCYGYYDKAKKTQYIFPRIAHIPCWLKDMSMRLVHVEKKTKKYDDSGAGER